MPSYLRLAGVAAAVAVLLSSCASGSHSRVPPAAPASTAAVIAPCAAQHCLPGPAWAMTDGFTVRLWKAAQPTGMDTSTPVVELLSGGRHSSWWRGRVGFGWDAELTCLATPGHPNCLVTSGLGAHAGSVETLLLDNGSLVSPPPASVVFDGSSPLARDLDQDGRLDAIGMENDYKPDFAHGHNYWATYRQVGASPAATVMQRTGCSPVTGPPPAAPPTRLLTGSCPRVAQA